MQIEFLQPARAELDDAVRYNSKECAGLGDEFLTENLKRVATRRRISACAASLFATDPPLPGETVSVRHYLPRFRKPDTDYRGRAYAP